jgi:ferredoxin
MTGSEQQRALKSMLIRVDSEICRGHARCNAAAPDIYPLDDDGYCAITELTVTSENNERALDGVNSCPEGAIRVEGI